MFMTGLTFHSKIRTAVLAMATLMMGMTAGAAPTADETKSAGRSQQASSADTATTRTAPAHGKLLFVVTTGLDDIQTMNGSLKHAKVAKETGYLEDIAWLAYGRGVQALAGNITARPPQTPQLAREAQKAGVRLMVCKNALDHMGIPEDKLDPRPEIVPNGAATLAELVSQGYTVISY